jgi:aspartate racemase
MNTIGVLGGMGSYATCDIFRRLLDAFPAEKEWERPRILIDNNCTMPSRVRAILYGEHEERLIHEMSESVESLVRAGADRILIGCMTAHRFRGQLPHQDKILDALAETRNWMLLRYEPGTEVFCLCTEGSVQAEIWTKALPDYTIQYPDNEQLQQLREFIEVVKQNRLTEESRRGFVGYINSLPCRHVLLGCTELPVLLGSLTAEREMIDPVTCAIHILREEFQA